MADDEKQFTQADLDKAIADATAKHQDEMNNLAGKIRAEEKAKADKIREEAEKKAKQANMTELEKANAELADIKLKYEESQNTIALTSQKDETRKILKELGVNESNLDYVFVPNDMDGTKAKAKAFKEMIDNVKKTTFEANAKSTIPKAGKVEDTDPFVQGFKTGSFK